jgi:hypothetical protein
MIGITRRILDGILLQQNKKALTHEVLSQQHPSTNSEGRKKANGVEYAADSREQTSSCEWVIHNWCSE